MLKTKGFQMIHVMELIAQEKGLVKLMVSLTYVYATVGIKGLIVARK